MTDNRTEGLQAALSDAIAGLQGEWPPRRVTPSPGPYTRIQAADGSAGYQRSPRPAAVAPRRRRGAWWIGAGRDGSDDREQERTPGPPGPDSAGAAGAVHVVQARAGQQLPGVRAALVRVPRRD